MRKLRYIVLFICLTALVSSFGVYPAETKTPIKSPISYITQTSTTIATATWVPKLTETPPPTPTETLTPTITATITPRLTETKRTLIPKILLLGDSMISLTRVAEYFSKLLEGRVEFVGDRVSPGNGVPTDGFGGFNTILMLRQLAKETVWTMLNGTQFPNNFDENIPDIVIIQLGTNDAVNALEGNWDPVPIYRQNMQKIIEFLRSKNPSVSIVVPMLIPSEWPEYTSEIDLINSTIPDFVEMMDRPNSRVVTTVNLKDAWKLSNFSDNVHPCDSGSQKIAESYFDALVNNNLFYGY